MLKIVGKLNRKDRSALPHRERCVFNLPLKLQQKQGNQQLQLWIKRTKLLFDTYTDVPLRNGQQRSITQWLQKWGYQSPETTMATLLRGYHDKIVTQSEEGSTDDEDDEEIRTQFSQMNLTNWLKSWGKEDDKQEFHKQSMQSNGDVRFLTNTLD
jgi:hypothetical protein